MPVRLHWSVLVTEVVFADLLAEGVLPTAAPHRARAEYWLAGALTAAALVVLIAAHEGAHAVMARRRGVRVRSVTLWALGGLTEFEAEPATPRADAAIAAAGPLISIASGLGIAAVTFALPHGALVAACCAWLAITSVFIGLFNLLPAAPLDGGRVLRAVLWHRWQDRDRADAAVARVGQGLGAGLVAYGLLTLLVGSVVGLWTALVGWFLLAGASAVDPARAAGVLAGWTAADVMRPIPSVASDWWTVSEFRRHVTAASAELPRVVLVDFDARLSGTLRWQDVERVAPSRRDETRLRELPGARRRPAVAQPSTPLTQLMPALLRAGIVIVVDEHIAPVGIVTPVDVERCRRLSTFGVEPVAATPNRTTEACP